MICRIFGHWWRTTHENRYGIATRQVCRCGVSREWKGGIGGDWHVIKPQSPSILGDTLERNIQSLKSAPVDWHPCTHGHQMQEDCEQCLRDYQSWMRATVKALGEAS